MTLTRTTLRPDAAPARSLAQLAERFGFDSAHHDDHVVVRGLSLHTDYVRDGDLFVALPGNLSHGAGFTDAARDRGAAAVLTDPTGVELAAASGLPVLVTADPRGVLGELSAWLYRTDRSAPKLFAVTGTNGKTSTVHLTEGILRQLGVVTGLSSTAERHIASTSVVSGLTTPEATELHALIASMREADVEAAAIEVSAQAISSSRVSGTRFEVVGFTNLSHDHLDDYPDMEAYLAAKAGLFTREMAHRGVISLDSPWGERLAQFADIPLTTISSNGVDADWRVRVTGQRQSGVDFELTAPTGEQLRSHLPVIGAHMAANAGLAIAMLVEGGYELAAIARALRRDGGILATIPGRTERVSGDRGPSVYVDFGHSPDAFAKTLDAVRSVTPGKVIMVFGADGDRDATKRPAMAEAAVEGSDLLVVTDHHPRFEDAASIRSTLVRSARRAAPEHPTIEVPDPKRAIREAVRLAHEGDSILWAGPGHQDYRDIRGEKVPYSARQEARMALREAGW